MDGSLPPRRCAVLGSPIAHSLSPVLHRAAYGELGLDWRYDAVEVDEPGLAGFLDGLGAEWRGLSLTMPLKRAVVPLLDEVEGRAVQAASANTVVLEDGRRIGHNTDVPGAVAALTQRWEEPVNEALVLGGGATAASLLLALADLGCAAVTLAVREPNRAAATLDAVGRHPSPPEVTVVRLVKVPELAAVDLVASTIPAGAQDDGVLAAASGAGVVFDVVYDPWPTPLAAAAASRGQVLVGGLDLLVHQAALQVELMTGRDAPVEAMAAAGEAALAER